MSEKKKYVALNLPEGLIEELKVWKSAYAAAYGSTKTYEEIMRGLLDSLEDTEPAVHAEFCRIVENHPELLDKFTQEA